MAVAATTTTISTTTIYTTIASIPENLLDLAAMGVS